MQYSFSKSRYCKGLQCPKMLWLKEHSEQFSNSVANESVLKSGNEVGDLAMGLFGEYEEVPYSKNLSEMILETEKLLKNDVKNICEASFSYDNCFCSVDILRNFGNRNVEIYEVKSSTSVKDIYKDDIAYQYFVLTKLGFNVQKVSVVHINTSYVKKGDIELDKLFTIVDLTDETKSKLLEVEQNIQNIRKFLENKTEPECKIGKHCFSPYECDFWKYCAELPENEFTVFDITNFRKSFDFYEKGLITFQQIYDSKELEKKGKENYLQQVEFEVKDLKPAIQKSDIKDFLQTLNYPLYFLDFETFNPAIPLYDNSRPYEQIPFQYSLHYMETENAKLKHTEFLGYPENDPRRELAEQLCKDIPLNSCIVAYNMSFEKGRLKELAELYPDLKEHLLNIHDNIKDLMFPFQQRLYYSKEMQGSYSIKFVLPALYPNEPSLNYDNLEDIHNGSDAMDIFAKMSNMTNDEIEKSRKNLLRYCELDTFAMVKVLEKLKEVVE